MKNIIIELTVKNHPGVMSRVTGLFSRRAFNLDGILCSRLKNDEISKIYLLVNEKEKLDNVMKQLNKLEDVIDVSFHTGFALQMFKDLYSLCNTKSAS